MCFKLNNPVKSLIAIILLLPLSVIIASEVNIYTSRHYDSDNSLYEDFTKTTGIKVNIITGKGEALIERIKSEGRNSTADIFFTADAGNLWKLQKDGHFRSITSKGIIDTIPKNLRGPRNEWVGIAKRARVIFYHPERVSSDEV